MLPYYLMILPSWICLALLLPLVQTFHALQHESADRKLWLFYWCLYCVASIFLYYFEWLICIPFYVISFYVDIYYETQLLVIFWLVYPKTLGIKNLQVATDSHEIAEFETTKLRPLSSYTARRTRCGAAAPWMWWSPPLGSAGRAGCGSFICERRTSRKIAKIRMWKLFRSEDRL